MIIRVNPKPIDYLVLNRFIFVWWPFFWYFILKQPIKETIIYIYSLIYFLSILLIFVYYIIRDLKKGAFCEHFLEITAKFVDEKSEFNHTRYKWQQFYTVSKKYNVIFLFLNKEKFYYPRKFFYLQRKDFSSKAEFDACFEICLIYFERSRWNRTVNYNN